MTRTLQSLHLADRDAYLTRVSEMTGEWDLIVIGGGATGLGIALDATTRGYKTLLLEQSDFAKGTSSRSTKLVHGGVRYLAQGDIRLVREASIERGLLHRNAPHLVRDQHFIVPLYSTWDRLKYTIGLKVYDWIAGRLSLGPSVFISREKTLASIPGIRPDNLKGGVLYHDGQFDDSRLALNLAQTIWENGGYAVNYMQVLDLHKNAQGKLNGVTAMDTESKKMYEFRARAIINATGVFVDRILQMDKPGSEKTICVSQGIHLVLDKKFYASKEALMIPKTSDGRVLFAVPWHRKVVIGTTDTPVDEASLEPQALEKEIDFILETAGSYLLHPPKRQDVLSVYAGLRPLAVPAKGKQKTKEISRSHKIIVSSSDLFTILGGKWTTYRKMAEDMVDRIEKKLGWKHRSPITASLPIHGHDLNTDWNDPFYYYGNDRPALLQQISNSDGAWLSEELQIHGAQVTWAIEHEMARTVEDFLSRRTRALLLNARECKRIAPQVIAIMAKAMNKDDKWKEEQLQSFIALSERYILK
jgi:glycerol-3-phosphate dehydrogenase